jgi:hypothetical protein
MEGAWWSRSILKMAAVCFAVAVALCCVWYWACGGCTGGEGAAAVLRSGNELSDLCLTAFFSFCILLGSFALSFSLSFVAKQIDLLVALHYSFLSCISAYEE